MKKRFLNQKIEEIHNFELELEKQTISKKETQR